VSGVVVRLKMGRVSGVTFRRSVRLASVLRDIALARLLSHGFRIPFCTEWLRRVWGCEMGIEGSDVETEGLR